MTRSTAAYLSDLRNSIPEQDSIHFLDNGEAYEQNGDIFRRLPPKEAQQRFDKVMEAIL